MKITLTLDDDVAALLKRVRDKRKAHLRQIVNEALREGLTRNFVPHKPSRPYRTPAVSLGRCLVGSLDDAAEALAAGEGEAFR